MTLNPHVSLQRVDLAPQLPDDGLLPLAEPPLGLSVFRPTALEGLCSLLSWSLARIFFVLKVLVLDRCSASSVPGWVRVSLTRQVGQ